jgi:uncharacterized membrane protein YczE
LHHRSILLGRLSRAVSTGGFADDAAVRRNRQGTVSMAAHGHVIEENGAMMTRRLLQLFIGLAMYGLSIAMFIRAGLGLDPWDVFHQGIAAKTGLSIGTVVMVTSFLVLLLWIPLRQRPGIGTLFNAVLVGVFADIGLALIPAFSHLVGQAAMLAGSVLLNAIASACYIGARLGPGPRDGLMTGLSGRTGWSVRASRTGIEVVVLAAGWLLGGSVGVGTVLYALTIGPLVQHLLPRFTVPEPKVTTPAASEAPLVP